MNSQGPDDATMLTLLIFIGEAVRDAFDPRKTQRL